MPHSQRTAVSHWEALPPAGPYPGNVPEAMPEGARSYSLGAYVYETIRRDCVDLARDSVHANMPIYHHESTRRRPVAPDVFVVRGLPDDPDRKSYCLWRPGAAPPQVVFEIVSEGSEWKDVVRNRKLYERLGVAEYYWFDPATEELTAYELHPQTGRYRKRRPDRLGRYRCRQIDLEVGPQKGSLGLYRNGEYIPPSQELIERMQEQHQRELELRDRLIGEKDRVIGEKDHVIAEQAAVLRPILLRRLAARFGPLPDSFVEAIERPANVCQLAAWLSAAESAASLEQVGIVHE